MDVLHPRCCGLDVHKSSISACILLREAGRDAETPASLWRDDPRTAGACRMATAVRCDSGSDGIQRRLVETSLEHSGGTVHGSFGKCAAHQECAGASPVSNLNCRNQRRRHAHQRQ